VDSLPLSGGTKLTEDTAVSMMKSHKVIAMSAANAKEEVLKWLRQFLGMSSALTLNVAGPRVSRASGIQVKANVECIETACAFFLYCQGVNDA
jgi:dihydroorotate dehydrogenase